MFLLWICGCWVLSYVSPFQKLPNFGPYLEEKKLAIANYKEKLTDLNKDNTPLSSGSRINTPKKPVPAVKVRFYLHLSSHDLLVLLLNDKALRCKTEGFILTLCIGLHLFVLCGQDVIARALKHIGAYQELNNQEQVQALIDEEMCINCGKCYMTCNDSGYQVLASIYQPTHTHAYTHLYSLPQKHTLPE